MDILKAKDELELIKKEAEDKIFRLKALEKQIDKQEKEIKIVSDSISDKMGDHIHSDLFIKFFKKPYVIIPQKQNQVLVAIPKFIKGFQVGWLWKETEQFYIYQLDQYSAWLGDVPSELLSEINFKKEIEAEIDGKILTFQPSQKQIIKQKLGQHITDISDTTARIIKGHEFDILADMIDGGSLPFKAIKVAESDKREGKATFDLRKYQKPAFERFLETGAIGLFHPTGAGKSMIAMKAIDIIKGKKLIVVPSRTLIEQWNYYIETFIPHAKNEITLITYQGYRISDEEYALTIYDECQRLPAETFSRLALVKTKYRIGLSASPHREDGRESYIFALTGFPVGLNWQDYMKEVGRSYHPVYVHVVRGENGKIKKARELLDMKKRTFIFCDTIELGKRMANEINVPFIYGETNERLQLIENNKVVVVSRVADLGVSVKDLQQIIEIDFLFGSRQQELQRTGRLMHSLEKDVRHDIIMTEQELQSYGKRLWALQEKGFSIKIKDGS